MQAAGTLGAYIYRPLMVTRLIYAVSRPAGLAEWHWRLFFPVSDGVLPPSRAFTYSTGAIGYLSDILKIERAMQNT